MLMHIPFGRVALYTFINKYDGFIGESLILSILRIFETTEWPGCQVVANGNIFQGSSPVSCAGITCMQLIEYPKYFANKVKYKN